MKKIFYYSVEATDSVVVLLSSKTTAIKDVITTAARATETIETPPKVTPTCDLTPDEAALPLFPLIFS